MTVKQRQHLLAYLGYYVGNIDGDWATLSREACRRFQQDFGGIAVDGFGGPETDKALRHAVANDLTKSEATPEDFSDAEMVWPGVVQNAPVDKIPENSVTVDKGKLTTGTFWDEIEFFDRDEFECQCGGRYCNGFPVEPQEKMVRTVNEIRRRLGVPVEIVTADGSGVRCPRHNANVGGVANSLHLTGNAADLHSEKSPEEMARVAEAVLGNTGEIGIYTWGIHVGIGSYSRFRG